MPAAITTPFQEHVRGTLTREIAELGFAPNNSQLASACDCSLQEVEEALRALHASHSLLLHPHKAEPWVVHPFALSPASCWVQIPGRRSRGYWATCLYCGMGIAAALRSDADITTRLGGEGETCVLRIRGQAVVEGEARVFHLPTPIRQWWDNVIHACATFQPFRDGSEVDAWCERHRVGKGAVVPMGRMWAFASEWYGGYVVQARRKRGVGEVREVLGRHGLVGEVWEV